MGKLPKNFALLKRRENQRISRRRLQESSSISSNSPAENERIELSTSDFNWKDQDWAPSLSAVFKILFSIRLSASLWSIISDCDEVYNYWEPLHLVLFKRGFQTWEYSPIYAIRSWLYILLYAAPAKFFMLFFYESKVPLFFSIRFFISLFTLFSELFLYRAICQRISNSIGRTFILFSMFSNAMFGASCAFLPSSFSMSLNAFASAFYLFEYWSLSILCTAISTLLGWPFAAILGLPIVIEMLIIKRKLFIKFIFYSLLFGVFLCLLLFIVDTHFFGKPVLAPLNIILYNIFSSNGPNLYGIEPISFYFRNLALNFNIVFFLVILSIPFCLLFLFIHKINEKRKKDDKQILLNNYFKDYSLKQWKRFKPLLFFGMTAFLWILIFMLQPHKEERFLFPIYPYICLLSAFSLDFLYKILNNTKTQFANIFYITILFIFIITSFSRIAALHRNYSGLLDTYKEFNNKINTFEDLMLKENNSTKIPLLRLCIGKEWHRFPSSFFLPENRKNNRGVEMRFIKSEFRALLPDIFPKGLTVAEITQQVPIHQNDENREQMERYVPLNSCNFLIDLAGMEPTEFEPDYSKMDGFQSIIQNRVLLSAKSHSFFRTFYIPFTPDEFIKFGTIHVLQNKLNNSF